MPNFFDFSGGRGWGNTRHTKSTLNNFKILSTPVPTSRYVLPLSDSKGNAPPGGVLNILFSSREEVIKANDFVAFF